MAEFNKMKCLIFLFVQLINFSLIPAFPDSLTVKIRDCNEIITLNWKKTDRGVANSNLPIWHARRLETPQLDRSIMNDIGPFAMYHDIEKSSAIVLFAYQERIFGVIDTRFLISALPLSEVGADKQHIVGGRFVKRRPRNDEFHDEEDDFPVINDIDIAYINNFLDNWLAPSPAVPSYARGSLPDLDIHSQPPPRPSSNSLPNIDVHDMYSIINAQAGPSNIHQVIQNAPENGDTLHAEILVLISHNVLRYFTKKSPDLKLLVAYYLIHFNAIDMLFAKLPNDLKIHINIAGLVIESQIAVFPYAFQPTNERPLRNLDGGKTLENFPKYIHRYRNVFPRDSYDFFYLSTRYLIYTEDQNIPTDNQGAPNFVSCDGLTRISDKFTNRKNSRSRFDVPGALLERKSTYGDYITSAHEIAHLLYVDHDPLNAGVPCRGRQCFAILQTYGSYCKNCINWSVQSVAEFRAYVSQNYNHCFLLNPPRSLYPYGTIMATVGPQKQCTCYDFQSHWKVVSHLDEVLSHQCNVKLACAVNNQPTRYAVPLPIDGTPCGRDKVCWREECVPVTYASYMQLLHQ